MDFIEAYEKSLKRMNDIIEMQSRLEKELDYFSEDLLNIANDRKCYDLMDTISTERCVEFRERSAKVRKANTKYIDDRIKNASHAVHELKQFKQVIDHIKPLLKEDSD